MNFSCAHPECVSGLNVEGHHIIPLSRGGPDAFWNIISLCKSCHRGKKLHSRWEKSDIELYTYKCDHELRRFGFFLDEKEPDFRDKLKKAVLVCHNEDRKQNTPLVNPDEV